MDATSRRPEEIVPPMISEAVRQEGAELVDVEFRREPAGWVLRVYIDKAGGVSLDDCRRVSEVVGTLLEVEDPIHYAYTLEISSPGLTRPLQSYEDWARAIGGLVKVVTRQAIAGRQALVGRLIEAGPQSVVIETEGQRIEVPRDCVARARREVEWPVGSGGSGRSRGGAARTAHPKKR